MKTSLLLIAVFVVLLVLVSFPEDTNAVVFVLSQGKIRSIERQRQIKKLTKRIKRIKALNRGKRKKKHSKRSQKLREMRRWLRRFKQKKQVKWLRRMLKKKMHGGEKKST